MGAQWTAVGGGPPVRQSTEEPEEKGEWGRSRAGVGRAGCWPPVRPLKLCQVTQQLTFLKFIYFFKKVNYLLK